MTDEEKREPTGNPFGDVAEESTGDDAEQNRVNEAGIEYNEEEGKFYGSVAEDSFSQNRESESRPRARERTGNKPGSRATTPSANRGARKQGPRTRKRRGKPVGILGFGNSGKTVFLSMLYHISAERAEFGAGDWYIDWYANDGGKTVHYLKGLSNSIIGLKLSDEIDYKDEQLRTKIDRKFPGGTHITSQLSFRMNKRVGLLDVPCDVTTQDVRGELLQKAVGDTSSISSSEKQAFDQIAEFGSHSKVLLIFNNALHRDIVHDRGSLMLLVSRMLEQGAKPKAIAFVVTGSDIFKSDQEVQEYRAEIEDKYAGVLKKLEQSGIHYRIFVVSSIGRNMTRKKDTSELSPQCLGANHICPDCQELTDDPGAQPRPEGFEEVFDYVFREISPVYARCPVFASIAALFKKSFNFLFGRWYSLLFWLLVAIGGGLGWLALEDEMGKRIAAFDTVTNRIAAVRINQQAANYTRWFRDSKCPKAAAIMNDWSRFDVLSNIEFDSATTGQFATCIDELRNFSENSKSKLFNAWASRLAHNAEFRKDILEFKNAPESSRMEYAGNMLAKWEGDSRSSVIENLVCGVLAEKTNYWNNSLKEVMNTDTESSYLQFIEPASEECQAIANWDFEQKDAFLASYSNILQEAREWKQEKGGEIIRNAYQEEKDKALQAFYNKEFDSAKSTAEQAVSDYPNHDHKSLNDLLKTCNNIITAQEAMYASNTKVAINILTEEMNVKRVPNSGPVIDEIAESWVPALADSFNDMHALNKELIDPHLEDDRKELVLKTSALKSKYDGLELLKKYSNALDELRWLSETAENLKAKDQIGENRSAILKNISASNYSNARKMAENTLQKYHDYCGSAFSNLTRAAINLDEGMSAFSNRNWATAIEFGGAATSKYDSSIISDTSSNLIAQSYSEWSDHLFRDYEQLIDCKNSLLQKHLPENYKSIKELRNSCSELQGEALIKELTQSREKLNETIEKAGVLESYQNLPSIPERVDSCDRKELQNILKAYTAFFQSPQNNYVAEKVKERIEEVQSLIDELEQWDKISTIYHNPMVRSDRENLMTSCNLYLDKHPDTAMKREIIRIIRELKNWKKAFARIKILEIPYQYKEEEKVTVTVKSLPSGKSKHGNVLASRTFPIENGEIGGWFTDEEIEVYWDPDRDLIIEFEFTNELGFKDAASQHLAIRQYRSRIGKKKMQTIKAADGIKTKIEIEMKSK